MYLWKKRLEATAGFEPTDRGFAVQPAFAEGHHLLADFLADRTARGLSAETIKFYDKYLERFVGFCQEPLAATPITIGRFLQSLSCSPGGKHAYFRAIRAFFRWLEEQEIIAKDPTRRMKAPKVPKPIRYAVPVNALDTLLAACTSLRDRLVVSLLADTGVRQAELAGVSVDQIDLASRTIRIWGKGAKQRLVRYGPRTAELLNAYLEAGACGDTLLNLTDHGIRKVLERLARQTGIKCNAHSFRRTFACESVRNGMNLFYVQSLLGHATLTMTRIYAEQVNSEDAIKAYKPIVS